MRRDRHILKPLLKLLWFVIFLTGSLKAFAVEEPYFNEIKGSQVVAGANFSVTDEKFINPSAWSLIDGNVPQTVDNILTFEYDFDQNYNFYNLPATCTINVTITKYNNSNDTAQSFGSETIDLNVNYDTASGSSYKGIAMYKFTGAYKFKILVNSISSPQYGLQIPPIFRVKGQSIINRKYLFNDNSTDVSNFQLTNTNEFSIFWTAANYPGAEMFDLEWTVVDDSSGYAERIEEAGGVINISSVLSDSIFKNNSTRITTAATAYTINLAYNSGYILYRIRGVQLRDNDAIRYEGNWNYQGQLVNSGNAGTAGYHIDWHEPNLNWQYSMSFAEEGKKKEVISYFDGTLHNRQSVTINNSDRKSIIQETIYDALGRPSVNILPVPTTDSTIHYFKNFNLNNSNIPYSFADFQTGTNCQISAQPLSTDSGASRYYSANNPFDNYYFAKYIPDAHQYPFTVTEYTPDQTGRIQRQGGVGDSFQLNTAHSTKYFYGKPNQNELDRLFGSEAGKSSHYLKNMAMDANGQISVSYVDANGKTIATSLAGLTPSNLSALPSNNTTTQVSDTTNELIQSDDFTRNAADYSVSATTTVMAAVAGDYQFSYNIDPLRLEVLHGDNNQYKICNSCYYDLLITLKNNCNITIDSINSRAGNVFDTSCNPASALNGQFTAGIPDIGEYYLTYTLKVSGDALDFYDSVHLVKNTNIKKANYFLREELKNTDFSGCYYNCETCETDLGLKADFIDVFRTLYTDDSVSFESPDSTWAGDLYDSLLANCNSLQASCKESPCQEKLDLIKSDVSPGAQYALYNVDLSGNYSIIEPDISVLSKYSTVSWFPDENGQRDSVTTYYNQDGQDSVRLPVNELTLQQFVENWKDSWADSLVRFHPEYCYYLWCTVNSNSFEFTDSIKNEEEGATSKLNGWYSRSKFDIILDHDPFFLPGGNGYPFRQQMSDSLRLFSRTVVGLSMPDRNILQYIDIILYCRFQINAFDTCHVDDSCRSENREWDIYKNFYLNLKGYFNEKARRGSTDPVFANCTNCFIGSDGLDNVMCTPPPISDFALATSTGLKLTVKYADSIVGVSHAIVILVEKKYIPTGTFDTLKIKFDAGQSIDTLHYNSGDSLFRIVGVYCDTLPATPFTTTTCDYNCPEGYYSPKDKPGMSFWIHHGTRYQPLLAPSPYGNCHFYSIINVKTDASTTCQFTNVWVCTYDSACGLPNCNTDPSLPSSCSSDSNAVKYKNKHRLFNEYINTTNFINGVLSGNPNQTSAQNADAIKAQGKDFCEAQADTWIQSLSKCSPDTNLLNQLKVQLIAICSASADSAHMFGASDNYTNPGLTYHTFEDAIKGILGPDAINDTCAAELLSMPYPYDKQPAFDNRTIIESDYSICNRLHQFEILYSSSGFIGTLDQFLQKQLGGDYRMSDTELADLKKSCTSCNGILQDNIEIPIAFEQNAKPCLICDSANALFTAFKNKFHGTDSTKPDYEILLANYFNHHLGFSLSFDDYKDFLDSCTISGYAFNLYNQSMTPQSDTSDDNSCTEGLFATASTNAHNIYVAYIDSVRRDFQEAYLNKCLNVQPQLSMIAKLYEYHYTLYYYDQSGNLVKTIPPEGVKLLTNEEVARVQLGRKYYREDCYQYADELNLNSGYADFAALPYLALHDSAFSVESYIYFNDNSSQGIYSQYDSANDKGYQLFVRNDSLVIRLSESVGIYLEATCGIIAQKVNLNAYNHIVIERLIDSLNPVKLFINGNNVPLTTINSDSGFVYNGDMTVNTDLLIGRVPSASGSFTGRIKQFRLYKRAMTTSEIRRNAFDNCLQPADKTALVLWAPINEGSGDSTKNIVDNKTGTLNGTWNWISNRIIIYPHHNLPSTYQYSSLNQVLQQYSPDGDTSHFWYDRLGRLTVSQNSEQLKNDSYRAAKGRYSYTTYDALGRITEVGEKSDVTDITSINTKDTAALNSWMASGTNKQATRTIYDQPDENIVSHPDITVNQSYATSRKRVVASLYSEAGTFSASSYDNGTHYAYDINGNVKTLWQEIGKMRLLSDSGIKRMDYDYDLVSGKVNRVMYQQGKGDQFFYKYLYDAENRVTDAQSSRDGLAWINDASYTYYLHGPLARTELGQYKLQGIDYAYTLQGWLKGINGAVLNSATDIGKDGNGFSTTFGRVARDVYGFTLGYYNNDYSPIGGTGASLGLNYSFGAPDPSSTGSGLFNGNISNTTLALNKFDTGVVAGYTYDYDQLNRLIKMNRHTPTAGSATWNNSSIIDAYKEQVSYDANGNILGYLRNGANLTGKPLGMDSLGYKYNTGKNQLNFVTDSVPSGNYSEDIDNQSLNNYQYDNIGNLKKDAVEGIDTVRWTVYGKINRVVKNAAGTTIDYSYDAAGNRAVKEVAVSNILTKTFYVRDAGGNVMAVYDKPNNGNLKWSEQHLYGTSRLGMWRIDSLIAATPPNANGTGVYDELLYGKRNYELSNHLGNVLAIISDKKIGHALNDTTIDYFNADVVSANDYYPGGMLMPGRSYSIASTNYRYGFNGKEADAKDGIIQYDYGFRIYDPRLVRFKSTDPINTKYPELTPYQFASNSPIEGIDLDGLEKTTYLYNFSEDKITKTKIEHPKPGPLGKGVLVKTNFGGETNYFYGNSSPSLPALIGSYEGVKKDKEGSHIYYLDKKNIPTIGYGHRVYPKEPYKPGTTLTERQAINLFYADQNRITSRADEFLKGLDLTTSQRNALYELSFNGGAGKVINFKGAANGKYAGENYFLQPKYLIDIDANVKRRYSDNLLYSEGLYLHLDKIKSSQEIKKTESFLNPPKKIDTKK